MKSEFVFNGKGYERINRDMLRFISFYILGCPYNALKSKDDADIIEYYPDATKSHDILPLTHEARAERIHQPKKLLSIFSKTALLPLVTVEIQKGASETKLLFRSRWEKETAIRTSLMWIPFLIWLLYGLKISLMSYSIDDIILPWCLVLGIDLLIPITAYVYRHICQNIFMREIKTAIESILAKS